MPSTDTTANDNMLQAGLGEPDALGGAQRAVALSSQSLGGMNGATRGDISGDCQSARVLSAVAPGLRSAQGPQAGAARKFALHPGAFDVTVAAGIVTVTGQVESRAVAVQLIDAVRHVEGVIGVRERVSYPC